MSSSSDNSTQANVSAGSIQIEPPEVINRDTETTNPLPPAPPIVGPIRRVRRAGVRSTRRLSEIERLEQLEARAHQIANRMTNRLLRFRPYDATFRGRRQEMEESNNVQHQAEGNQFTIALTFSTGNSSEPVINFIIGTPEGNSTSFTALNNERSSQTISNNETNSQSSKPSHE